MLSTLPAEIDADLTVALALLFLLTASMLGGLMRTFMLLLVSYRLIRLGIAASMLSAIAGLGSGLLS